MNAQKQEAERIVKTPSKITAITLREADAPIKKKQEHQSLTCLVDQKITQGKEITVIVIQNQHDKKLTYDYEVAFNANARVHVYLSLIHI